MMKIAIGSDHGGFEYKEIITNYLQIKGYKVKDFGTYNKESCNYPEIAKLVSESVINDGYERGILICGTGIGMSIAANKVKGIRAALCSDTFSAHATREHNDSNILCLGQRVIGENLALEIVDRWLEAKFEGGRHQVRIDMIKEMES